MKIKTSQTIEIAILLALSGGFMDAYSYICRGEVFANAQTGNMLLFGVCISEGRFVDSVKYFSPVLFFGTGIFFAEMIKQRAYNLKKILNWEQIVILVEILIFIIVSRISLSHNLIANNLISFACGMQVESFRKFHGNNMATTMCIGNLRAATEHMHTYLHKKDKYYLKRSIFYYFEIMCFILGAIAGNFSVKHFSVKSILIPIIFLILVILILNKDEMESILKIEF